MLIQIIHTFYYQGDFMFFDVEFMKSLKYFNFLLLNIFYFKATNGSP